MSSVRIFMQTGSYVCVEDMTASKFADLYAHAIERKMPVLSFTSDKGFPWVLVTDKISHVVEDRD